MPTVSALRQVERELRLVDDPGQVRAGAAALSSACRGRGSRSSASTPRRSTWSGPRRAEAPSRPRSPSQGRSRSRLRERRARPHRRAASAASSIRSEGTSVQLPATSTGADQRGLATRNGRSMPSSASSPGSSSRPQRTITAVPARTRRKRRRRASRRGPSRGRARSRATARDPRRGRRPVFRPRARARPPCAR